MKASPPVMLLNAWKSTCGSPATLVLDVLFSWQNLSGGANLPQQEVSISTGVLDASHWFAVVHTSRQPDNYFNHKWTGMSVDSVVQILAALMLKQLVINLGHRAL